jgi:hypothetical protein
MKTNFILALSLLLTVNTFSQDAKGLIGEENWFQNWTNFKPATTEYKEATIILSGTINENTTLYKKNVYRITGNVYVSKNAILTIEPGTVLRGDQESNGTLIITKGSKIIAEGLETDPIVFTSNKNTNERKAGDWGGIIVLGDAPINKFGGISVLDLGLDQSISVYGGLDEASDSGVFKYVRIEYAGKKLKNGKEYNGLSLAGVGNQTKLDFIQVSFSNDDSFECYGGNVNLNNLISYKATDDDFDFTQGTQCSIKNSIAMRYPYVSDASKSRAIEVDSYDKVENMDFTKNMTKINAINVVLANNEENLTEGLIREAIYVKDKSSLSLDRCVITGFNSAIVIAEGALNKSKDIENITFKDSNINNCVKFLECEYNGNSINTDYQNSNYFINNQMTKIANIELYREFNIKKNPDFRLRGSSNFAFSK